MGKGLIGSVELNRIYQMDCNEGLKLLPNESVDLIIVDPPYFRAIKERWDRTWADEGAYYKWVESWVAQLVRVMKPKSSLFFYGNFDVLTNIKVNILDKSLNFRQNITLSKGLKSIAGRTSDKLRTFPTASEYCLFYEKQTLPTWLRHLRERLGFTTNDVDVMMGRVRRKNPNRGTELCRRWEEGSSVPSEEDFQKLCKVLLVEGVKYQDLVRPFNLPFGITDVWDFTPDKVRYGHPTQKPSDICDRLISSCSNEGDIVLVPFCGSGSECVSALKLNRKFISFELEREYIEIANQRIDSLDCVPLRQTY